MKDIRIAAVIFNSPINQTRNNLDRMDKWVDSARKLDAAIVCFPELNVTGYSIHEEIKKTAEPIPGGASQHLLQMAQEHQMVILAGLVERDETEHVFASHLVVTPNGITGVYRKIHIAPPERDIFSPGDEVLLFNILGVKFGIQLCYDVHFPELSTRMAADGADVLFMPHASPRGTPAEKFNSWMRHLTARAFDNGLFVVACNQTGENRKGLRFPGIAVVIGPDGEVIKKETNDDEGIIVADLTSDDLKRVRQHQMRYFLPNRRPEIYYS
ncbi:MAG: nitrilase [Desulfobacterales bacterium]|nr:MAG: nitrilase [Desulfobacterales bacterium]